MGMAYCPECDTIVTVLSPREGDLVTCHICGTRTMVINTDPFELDYVCQDEWDDAHYEITEDDL
jgi:hypothetical protein